MYGGRERYIQGTGKGDVMKRDLFEDPGVKGRLIFRWIFRKFSVGGMDWIELGQDRDRWRELVNVVMNYRVP